MMWRLFTLLSAVSLALALATAMLWARSYTKGDVFDLSWGQVVLPGRHMPNGVAYGDVAISRGFGVRSVKGGILVGTGISEGANLRRRIQMFHNELSVVDWPDGSLMFNVEVGPRDRRIPEFPFFDLTFPHPLLVAILMICPALCWCRFRRRHRGASGLCPRCGYDLRASNDRCPECGTPIQRNAEASV